MIYTLRILGVPVATLTAKDTDSTSIIYNSGGSFEICPEPVEEDYYEEEDFGFRRPR